MQIVQLFLQIAGRGTGWGGDRVAQNPMRAEARAARAALARLTLPLLAVQRLMGASADTVATARRILCAEMRRRDRPYWGWDAADWEPLGGLAFGIRGIARLAPARKISALAL